MACAVVMTKLLGAVGRTPPRITPASARMRIARPVIRAVIQTERKRTVGACVPKVTLTVAMLIRVPMVGALLGHVNDIATGAEVALLADADAACKTGSMAGAVASP